MKNKKSFKLSAREKFQSTRQQKISQEIHSSLIECFKKNGRLDQRLESTPLSITKVNISGDLRVANCYFIPFNTKLTHLEISEALESSRFAIREYVTHKLNLKYSPEIRFHYDAAFENFEIIEMLLKRR